MGVLLPLSFFFLCTGGVSGCALSDKAGSGCALSAALSDKTATDEFVFLILLLTVRHVGRVERHILWFDGAKIGRVQRMLQVWNKRQVLFYFIWKKKKEGQAKNKKKEHL